VASSDSAGWPGLMVAFMGPLRAGRVFDMAPLWGFARYSVKQGRPRSRGDRATKITAVQVHWLEYAKVPMRDDEIKVEVRDGTKIVQRSVEYFPN
jgi:hypothetical protein